MFCILWGGVVSAYGGMGYIYYYIYILLIYYFDALHRAYIIRPALSVCTKNGESVVVECLGALGSQSGA